MLCVFPTTRTANGGGHRVLLEQESSGNLSDEVRSLSHSPRAGRFVACSYQEGQGAAEHAGGSEPYSWWSGPLSSFHSAVQEHNAPPLTPASPSEPVLLLATWRLGKHLGPSPRSTSPAAHFLMSARPWALARLRLWALSLLLISLLRLGTRPLPRIQFLAT